MVGDGLLVAKLWPFDTEFFCLRINPLDGGALVVNDFVAFTVAVELIAKTGADGGGQGCSAATLRPPFMVNGAGLSGW